MRVFPRSLIARCSFASIRRLCYGACIANFSERSVGGAHGEACFSLKTIYLAALTAVFAVSFSRSSRSICTRSSGRPRPCWRKRARSRARWTRQFMDEPQSIINNSSSGGYEFKACTARWWARASAGCSLRARLPHPVHELRPAQRAGHSDEFETKASRGAFNADRSVTEYGVALFDGETGSAICKRSKWTTAASECHGEPVGEPDITDHAKGWTLESVGGPAS